MSGTHFLQRWALKRYPTRLGNSTRGHSSIAIGTSQLSHENVTFHWEQFVA